MIRNRRFPLVFVAVFALLLFAACAVTVVTPEPVYTTQEGGSRGINDTNFTNVVASGDLTAGDDLTVGDDATIAGIVSAGEFAGFVAQSAVTVTDGGIITATGTYQPLTAAGTVTATVAAGAAGRVLVLVNTAAQTINIQDTGIQKLSAAIALGQYDSLILWSDGTNWIEISRSDN